MISGPTGQPLDSDLTALAAVTPSAAGLSMLSAASAAAQAALLGVVSSTVFDAYAVGTAYQLTNTSAALTFGTTQPSITLTTAGTYRIWGRVNLKYNAATFAAVRTITLKLRRTNNTAADITSGSATFLTDIITLLTYTAGLIVLPEVTYVTALTNDAVTIFGDVSVVPTAGSFDVVEASIHAQRIA